MAWRLAFVTGLAALLCPALAKAQTNLDQGKSPAQIYATVCVECHKEPHGLAKGRSAAALADFLREHYTTNAQQAASLAAYVAGGRAADTAPATQGRGAKPAPEHASVEEPKPNRQGRLARPEERSRRNPAGQATRPAEQEDSTEQPTITRPVSTPPATSAHNRHKEPKTPAPTATTTEPDAGGRAPNAAAAEPAPAGEPPIREQGPPPAAAATPAAAAAPASAAPAEAAPAEAGENAPVPRDHIPD